MIARYEVGLTQKLLKAGLRCRPLWPYHQLLDQTAAIPTPDGTTGPVTDPIEQMRLKAAHRIRSAAASGVPLNPTAELWRQLLLAGFPFLKVELLRKNPTEVPDIVDWRSVLADLPEANIAIIERDLQMQGTILNRAP